VNPVRVLLGDDHALVRAGIRALIERQDGFEVVGEASTGYEAVELVAKLRPDIAMLNISMPQLTGLEATARIVREYSRTRVIIASLHSDPEYVRRALALGASGYLVKTADPRELGLALAAVARGEVWLSPFVSRSIVNALTRGEKPPDQFELLSSRQREVLQLVAEGYSSKEIASRLRVSAKTVEAHRAQLSQRLGVRGVPGLVRWAIRLGVISQDA
jgi:DNA-binding NarL/FixJ family response regulator